MICGNVRDDCGRHGCSDGRLRGGDVIGPDVGTVLRIIDAQVLGVSAHRDELNAGTQPISGWPSEGRLLANYTSAVPTTTFEICKS